jgi:phage shock protein A
MLALVDVMVLVVIVLAIMVLLNKGAMKKFKDFFAAMLGKAADEAQDSDLVASYKFKMQQKGDELKQAMAALENHHALKMQIERELASVSGEYTLFEVKIKELMDAGKSEEAMKYANAMVKLEERLSTLKARLSTLEAKYVSQASQIKDLREKYKAFQDKSKNLETDLEISKNEAAISNLFKKFENTSFDDLSEIEGKIQNKIHKNESVSIVTEDLGVPDLKAEIQSDLVAKKAAALLAKYKKEAPQ